MEEEKTTTISCSKLSVAPSCDTLPRLATSSLTATRQLRHYNNKQQRTTCSKGQSPVFTARLPSTQPLPTTNTTSTNDVSKKQTSSSAAIGVGLRAAPSIALPVHNTISASTTDDNSNEATRNAPGGRGTNYNRRFKRDSIHCDTSIVCPKSVQERLPSPQTPPPPPPPLPAAGVYKSVFYQDVKRQYLKDYIFAALKSNSPLASTAQDSIRRLQSCFKASPPKRISIIDAEKPQQHQKHADKNKISIRVKQDDNTNTNNNLNKLTVSNRSPSRQEKEVAFKKLEDRIVFSPYSKQLAASRHGQQESSEVEKTKRKRSREQKNDALVKRFREKQKLKMVSANALVFRINEKQGGGPELLRQKMEKRGWLEWNENISSSNISPSPSLFNQSQPQSYSQSTTTSSSSSSTSTKPSEWNLWWRTNRSCQDGRVLLNSQKLNMCPASANITRKDNLVRAYQRMRQLHGSKVYNFVPNSYILPNDHSRFVASHHARVKKYERALHQQQQLLAQQHQHNTFHPTTNNQFNNIGNPISGFKSQPSTSSKASSSGISSGSSSATSQSELAAAAAAAASSATAAGGSYTYSDHSSAGGVVLAQSHSYDFATTSKLAAAINSATGAIGKSSSAASANNRFSHSHGRISGAMGASIGGGGGTSGDVDVDMYGYDEVDDDDAEHKPVWIVKPTDLSRGRGIHIIEEPSDIRYHHTSYILQQYLSNPLLISGYKFDLRLYVCVLNYKTVEIFVFEEGLVRFSTDKFNMSNLSNTYSHLTNTSINKNSPFYWDKKMLCTRIIQIIIYTVTMISRPKTIRNARNYFDLYGFDILVDANMKPWLLEVNICPALSSDTDVDTCVKEPMLDSLLNLLTDECCKRRPGDTDKDRRHHSTPTRGSAQVLPTATTTTKQSSSRVTATIDECCSSLSCHDNDEDDVTQQPTSRRPSTSLGCSNSDSSRRADLEQHIRNRPRVTRDAAMSPSTTTTPSTSSSDAATTTKNSNSSTATANKSTSNHQSSTTTNDTKGKVGNGERMPRTRRIASKVTTPPSLVRHNSTMHIPSSSAVRRSNAKSTTPTAQSNAPTLVDGTKKQHEGDGGEKNRAGASYKRHVEDDLLRMRGIMKPEFVKVFPFNEATSKAVAADQDARHIVQETSKLIQTEYDWHGKPYTIISPDKPNIWKAF